jgi:hypothetical protein
MSILFICPYHVCVRDRPAGVAPACVQAAPRYSSGQRWNPKIDWRRIRWGIDFFLPPVEAAPENLEVR